MASSSIVRYLNPWRFRREQQAERLKALRERDGDACARCRRPVRFDLTEGHDQGAKVELVIPANAGGGEELGNLRLCHRRCNAPGLDHTSEVTERMRRKNEAALLSKSRKKPRKAA
jgi:5-methylcytosine-specific restriction endonuclease McrA